MHGSTCLNLCLASIFEHNAGFDRVILVNNSPTPLSRDDVGEYWDSDAVVVKNIHSVNNSIAKSWNVGIANRGSDVFLISNDDVIYAPDSINSLYKEYLKSHYDVLCPMDFYSLFLFKDRLFGLLPDEVEREMQNKRFYVNFNILNSVSSRQQLTHLDLQNMCRSRMCSPEQVIVDVYGSIEQMNGFVSKLLQHVKEFSFLHDHKMGFSFMMSDMVLEKVGFFDENFQIGYWEDVDYQRRCEIEGIKWGTTEKAFVHHIGSCSFNGVMAQGNTHFHDRNKQFLADKEHRFRDMNSYQLSVPAYETIQVPLNMAAVKMLRVMIDPSQMTTDGNCLCFCNLLGDPLYYVWLTRGGSGMISITHGYHDGENGWMTFSDDASVGGQQPFCFEITDGGCVCVGGVYLRDIPQIETAFLTFGDARGKTPNCNAGIEIEVLDLAED